MSSAKSELTTETQRTPRVRVFPRPGDDGQGKESVRLRLKKLLIMHAITIALLKSLKDSCPKGGLVLANRRLPIGQKEESLCVLCVSVVNHGGLHP